MSCPNCEKETGERVAWYRWGVANIGLIGCPKHVKEVLDYLNKKGK